MADLSNIALQVGRGLRTKDTLRPVADIIEFVESSWGLGGGEQPIKLFPVQRVILKAHYGIALDTVEKFPVADWRGNVVNHFTEAEYLRWLFEQGRCNISEVIPGVERRELVLSIGRRSGKTFLAAAIAAYETYKLILKDNPQAYYGIPPSNNIQIVSVATDKEQAGLLYQEASGHFRNCFASETEILTADGIKAIGPLAGTIQTLLTGNGSWVDAPIRSFGKQRLWKLVLVRQGIEKIIYTTGDHRWFARDCRKVHRGQGFKEFKTTELRPGKHHLQYVFGRSYKNIVTPSPFGIAHGFTFGDGCTAHGYRNATSVKMIGEKDSHLRPYFALCPQRDCPEIDGVEASVLPNFFRELPYIRENKAYLLGWLMGYFAADGTVSGGSVRLSSVLRKNIEFVRDVCAVIGIGTYSIQEDTRISNLTGRPFTMYQIGLMRSTLDESFFIIPNHRKSFMENGGEKVGKRNWTVKEVTQTDRHEEVYCATVEGHGTFTLDGNIVTGNCGFFSPYTAANTLTYARFQTPKDIERYGRYGDDKTAKATIKVTFRSCIAKGLRGAGNVVVILDELAHYTDDGGQSSADAVYNAITPSTSAFSPKDPKDPRIPTGDVEGRIISISSPLGRQGQFYKLFQIAMRGGMAGKNMLAIQAPSWEVNPTIPSNEFEKHYLKDPIVFFTEYGGEFTDRSRGWIEREQDLMACVEPTHRPSIAIPARRPHFIGIDVGLVNDASAVAIGHIDEKRRIVLDYVDQIKAGEGQFKALDRLEFEGVAEWVHQLSKRFYLAKGMFDQWAGIPFEQALHSKGLRQLESVHMTKPIASEMFRNFKDMMFDKRLVLYDWPLPVDGSTGHCDYIQELLELQAEYHSKYVITVAAPNVEGKHDDRADAIVRMVWLASQNLSNMKVISGTNVGAVQGVAAGRESAYRKAFIKSRLGGTSPDRQPSLSNSRRFRGRGM